MYRDKITTGGQGPKMGRSKDLYRYYSVKRAAKMGAYVYMGRVRSMGPYPRGVCHTLNGVPPRPPPAALPSRSGRAAPQARSEPCGEAGAGARLPGPLHRA